MSRKNKSVSFDLGDAYEKDLLKYAEDKEGAGKFSRYIKRLIAQDREGGMRALPTPMMIEEKEEDNDAMSGFM